VSEHALHAKNMGSRKRFPSDHPVVDVTQKKNMFLYPTMTKPFRTGPLMPLIQQVLSWASIFPGTLHHRDALNPELGNRHSGSLKKIECELQGIHLASCYVIVNSQRVANYAQNTHMHAETYSVW